MRTNIIENYQSHLNAKLNRLARKLDTKEFILGLNYSNFEQRLGKRLDLVKMVNLNRIAGVAENVYPGKWDMQFEVEARYKDTRSNNPYTALVMEALDMLQNNIFRCKADYDVQRNYSTKMVAEMASSFRDQLEFTFSPKLIIHFPDVTIRRELNNTEWPIKDLFVRIEFTFGESGSIRELNIQGTRTSVSHLEHANSYVHSHLPGCQLRNKIAWNKFCIGSGALNSIKMSVNGCKLDEYMFKMLLLEIQTFVECESSIGSPHKYFRDIVQKEVEMPEVNMDICNRIATRMENNMKERVEYGTEAAVPNWTFDTEAGKYRILPTEEYNTFLLKYMMSNYVLNQTTDGKIYANPINTANNLPEIYPNNWLPFRGEKIPFKLLATENVVQTTKVIHPKILYYVNKRLEDKLNTYYTNKKYTA